MTNNTIFNTTKTLEEYSEKKLFGVGEMPLLNTIHKNYPELWKTYKDMKALDWDENEIDYQLEVSDGGTTDGTAIHLTREGIPTGVLSVPTRYIHTTVSVCSMKDVESTIQLTTEAINSL